MKHRKQALLQPEDLLLSPETPDFGGDGVVPAALQSGLVAPEELEHCTEERNERIAGGESVSLEDVLMERKLLRPRDVETLRRLGGEKRDMAVPLQIGRYRILEEAGRGGCARVYLAEDTELRRPVALKILQSIDPTHVARFRREALVAASLDHPNIVRVYDAGVIEGRAYLAMQFITGKSVDQCRLSWREVVPLIRKIADALEHAHQRQVLHRDVKPSNILMDRRGEVYLADFGLGRETHSDSLSRTGAVLGTPAYMSPEQARGTKDLDGRSDVYALGATMYELLTGHPAHEGSSTFEILENVCRGEIVSPRKWNPRIPRDLERILFQAMARERENRYSSAAEFAADLGRFLEGKSVLARPVRWVNSGWRQIRRRLTVVVAPFVLLGLAGLFLAGRSEPVPAKPVRQDLILFQDDLSAGWMDWSWKAEADYASTDRVAAGERSIRVRPTENWGALSFGTHAFPIQNPGDFVALEFQVHGGAQPETLFVTLEGKTKEYKSCNVGLTGNHWKTLVVPLDKLNPKGLPFERVDISSDLAGEFHVDEIRLVGREREGRGP